MKFSFEAMFTIGTMGAVKAARETKVIADSLKIASDAAAQMDSRLGRAGTTAAKKSGAFNDRDSISTRENRGAKGVSGQRGAAGRDFAGLRDASDSTSGIVAAYATAAANMFAITAAFKALSDAAKVKQLKEGLELVGAQSGVTLGLVAKKLEKVTGYGISAADAMKSVASATAAGFSGKEIERLGGVARGAAVALGRDLGDAMDRLTRGSIKLEPELLDELGIMTRIDDAVSSYANAHNKAKSSLTQTERRQAFLNAVLQEGEDKFSAISEAVPISAYDKLTAAMKNMSTTGIGFLVDRLEPLIDLLTALPLLILVPISGVLQSVIGKMIPTAEIQFKKLTATALVSAKAFKEAKKASDVRVDEISGHLANARVRSGAGFDALASTDDVHIKKIREELDISKQLVKTAANELDIARQLNAENSSAVRVATSKLANAQAIVGSYSKAIQLTKEDIRYNKVFLAKTAKGTFTNNSAKQFDRTQHLLAEREGNPLAQVKTMAKGMAAQWAEASTSISGYRIQVAAANADVGKGGGVISKIAVMWTGLGIRVGAVGVMMKLAMQGVAAAIPIIGWIVVAFTLIGSLWEALKSDKTKALEAYNEGLKEILKTSVKVNEEVLKFRDKGQYGRAFEADVGSMKEVIEKLKEGIALRGKSESDFKTKSVDVSKKLEGSDLDDADKKLLDQTLARIEKFKSPTEFKKLSTEILGTAKNGGDFGKSLDKAVEDIIPLEKSWTNIAESAKKGGDAVRKFYGADAYKTDYTDIADQLKEFGLEVANQQKGIANSPELTKGLSSSVTDLMRGGREYFEEMDRLIGESSTTYRNYFDNIKVYQDRTLSLKGKTDPLSLKMLEQDKAKIQEFANMFALRYQADAIASKGEVEALKVKTKEFRSQVAKSALQLEEIKNANVILTANIAKSEEAIKRSRALNGLEGSGAFGAIEAVKMAQITYSNAVAIATVRKESIEAEYQLLEANKSFEYIRMLNAYTMTNNELKSLKVDEQGKVKYSETKYGDKATADAVVAELQAKFTLLNLLRNSLGNSANIVVAQKKAIDLATAGARVELDSAKETLRLYAESDKKRQDAAVARYTAETKLLELSLKSIDNALELEKIKATNIAAAARGNLGGSLTKDVEVGFAIKDVENAKRAAAAKEENRKQGAVLTESSLLANLSKINDQVSTAKDDSAYAAIKVDQDEAKRKLFEFYALEAETTKNFTSEQALLVEKLFGLNNDLSRLDLATTLKNKLTETKGRVALAKGSAIDNAGGWGAEFQANIQTELANNKTWGNDVTKLLADPKAVAQIRAASQELAALNLVAESTQKISEGFHSELVGAFTAIIDGSKDAATAFADMALSMLKMIADVIAQLLAAQAVQMIGASFGLKIGAAGGTIPKKLADGGIMSRAGGGLQGVVNKPTYLVGEGRYNEAVVPLPNGRAIPVQMHGNNTSSNNVQVNVHLNQQGEAKTETQGPDMSKLGAVISQIVVKELQAQKMPGGVLNRYGAA